MDRVEWIMDNLVIEPKSGGLVPLLPNKAQIVIFAALNRQILAKVPPKAIILKARQLGSSTAVAGWFFSDAIAVPGTNCLIAAHDSDSSGILYRKYQVMLQHLPTKYKKPTDYTNRKEVIFSSPHNSRIRVQTAGNINLGRSDTIQRAHLSEVAWWEHGEQSMASVQQAITPDAIEIWESTANGMDGLFYDQWYKAVAFRRDHPRSLEGFTPLFIPWTVNPEYARKPPKGVEVEPVKGLTIEQAYWRERCIDEKCQGDIELFRQEYPSTPDEAFITSGRNVFTKAVIEAQRSVAKGKTGSYVVFDKEGPHEAFRRTNCWRIIQEPTQHGQYTLGADVAEGQLSDRNSDRSEPDYSAAAVLDRHSLNVMAVWHGRAETYEFGRQCLYAAKWYNQAWASPEANGAGLAVLNVFMEADYERLYQRESPDEYVDESERGQYGWRTTVTSRKLLVDDFIQAVNRGGLKLNDERIVDEMVSFVRDKTGKAIHAVGKHDDLLFAVMIALQLHIRCPYIRGLEPGLSVASDLESANSLDAGRIPSYAFAGGIDDWQPEDEDEDGYE